LLSYLFLSTHPHQALSIPVAAVFAKTIKAHIVYTYIQSLEEKMKTSPWAKRIQGLLAHVRMIQNSLDNHSENPNFYTTNLSGQNSSIKDRTSAIIAAISSLNLGAAFVNPYLPENIDKYLIENSGPLTTAIDELLNTLDAAKNTDNPIPDRTWNELFCKPLKVFANLFLESKNQYSISTKDSRHAIRDTMSKINDAREPTPSKSFKAKYKEWRKNIVSADKKKPSTSDQIPDSLKNTDGPVKK
jgi:hypothetical protein